MTCSISTETAWSRRIVWRRYILVGCVVAFLAVAAQAQDIPVRSLAFEGNHNIDSGRLRGLLINSRVGGGYNPEILNRGLQVLEKYYQDQGFLKAKIGPPIVDLESDSGNVRYASVRVPVAEGPLFRTGRIEVKNVQVFLPATLMQMCPLSAGQPYNRQKLAEWESKIEDAYRTMGYIRFQASVHEDVHAFQDVVDCALECKEGTAYSVGKISIVGSESIDAPDFKRHLLVSEGGLFNPEMVYLTVQFLNQMNVYRPISYSDVEIKINDESSTVDLIFHVALLRKPS